MNNPYPFNTPVYLWENYRSAFPKDVLHIQDGYVTSAIEGTIGCFKNQNEAIFTLATAGWVIHTNPDGKVTATDDPLKIKVVK